MITSDSDIGPRSTTKGVSAPEQVMDPLLGARTVQAHHAKGHRCGFATICRVIVLAFALFTVALVQRPLR